MTAREAALGHRGSLGAVLAACVVAALLLAGLVAARADPPAFARALHWLPGMVRAAGWAGIAGFALAQIGVAASGVLPASVLGIVAGAACGIPLGFALAGSSTMLGAWLAFRLSRSIFRPRVERLLARRPRLTRLDGGLARERWRLVCLLRVSPVMPFAATSYTLGLSSVAERDYLLGTLAAMPALLGYVCLGALTHAGIMAGLAGAGPFRWTLLGAGALATVVLTLRVGWLIARSASLAEGAAGEPTPN